MFFMIIIDCYLNVRSLIFGFKHVNLKSFGLTILNFLNNDSDTFSLLNLFFVRYLLAAIIIKTYRLSFCF